MNDAVPLVKKACSHLQDVLLPLVNGLDEAQKNLLLPHCTILTDILQQIKHQLEPNKDLVEFSLSGILSPNRFDPLQSSIKTRKSLLSPVGPVSPADETLGVSGSLSVSSTSIGPERVGSPLSLSMRSKESLRVVTAVQVFVNNITSKSIGLLPSDTKQGFLDKALSAFGIPEERQHLYTLSVWTETKHIPITSTPMDCFLYLVSRSSPGSGPTKFHLHRKRIVEPKKQPLNQFEGTIMETWKPREGDQSDRPIFKKPFVRSKSQTPIGGSQRPTFGRQLSAGKREISTSRSATICAPLTASERPRKELTASSSVRDASSLRLKDTPPQREVFHASSGGKDTHRERDKDTHRDRDKDTARKSRDSEKRDGVSKKRSKSRSRTKTEKVESSHQPESTPEHHSVGLKKNSSPSLLSDGGGKDN